MPPPAAAPAPVNAIPPASVIFPVWRCPINALASRYGMVSAMVTHDLHGKGVFSTHINGEAFTGDVLHCCSQGTPSWLPSLSVPGQLWRNQVASAQAVICQQRVRPLQRKLE